MESPEQPSPPLLRPLPRRPFAWRRVSSYASSNDISHPPTSRPDRQADGETDPKSDISRTRSIVNLTSSTLFGIYAPTSFNDASAPPTPWGTGAETPIGNGSMDGFPSHRSGPPKGSELEARLLRENEDVNTLGRVASPSSGQAHYAPRSTASTAWRAGLRIILLFCFGLAYGGIIAHLHDNRNVAPVKVTGLNRASWRYLAFWGVAGVAMGSLLPWIDEVWGTQDHNSRKASSPAESRSRGGWNDVVRSVGAFVGVAFAIRKLPWSSPLQLSLTLALANPFLWYLLDRTTTGFTLSTSIGVLGTSVLLAVNPALIPAPTDTYVSSQNSTTSPTFTERSVTDVQDVLGSLLSYERVGVATWIASVLFCSCVCFGNIGRLLVPGRR